MMQRAEQLQSNYQHIQLCPKGIFSNVCLGGHIYLSAPVAINVLNSRVDSTTPNGFRTEMPHATRMSHPYIIQVFDLGMEATIPFPIIDCAPLLSSPAAIATEVRAGSQDYSGSIQRTLVPLTPMVGREQELKEAHACLLRPEVRLLTLTGPGGVGKTRFALTLGSNLLPDFDQHICVVRLAPLDDPDLVVPTILHGLGVSEHRQVFPFEQLVASLTGKPFLLLLDGFEHLLPAAPQLPALLAACPQLKILVTSRAVLLVEGEHEFAVPPLTLPDKHHLPDVEDLSHVEAVALFLQCARARNHKFKLTQDNAATIAEICIRLEGLPLAIELAAGRCKALSLQTLLSRLEHSLEVLTGGKQQAAAHQQSLHDTVAWSYDLLPPEEQLLFRRLSIFDGKFSLEDAEAVTMALGEMTVPVLDGVTSLIDKSLLKQEEQEGSERHLRLLGFMREYGLECLATAGELERARDEHAQYYLALAEKAEPALKKAEQGFWLERLEHQHDNLRAALLWLLQRHRVEEALRLVIALEQFWLKRDYASEGYSFLAQALEVSCERNVPLTAPVKARALSVSDTLVCNQENGGQVIDLVEKSAKKSRPLPLQPQMEGRLSGSNVILNSPVFTVDDRDTLSHRATKEASPPFYEALTPREIEVMHLLAMGLKNAEIAERLTVSPHTVNGHVQSIYGKLGVNSRSAVTRYALKYRLV